MERNIKLFVTDMDGTLLNDEHKISRENLIALKELKEIGIDILVATGRANAEVKAYIRELGIDAPVICCNGGYITNVMTKEHISINDISKESVFKTMELCRKYRMSYILYGDENIYVDEISEFVLMIQNYNKTLQDEDKIPLVIVDDINKVINSEERVVKILISCEGHDLFGIVEKELEKIENTTTYKSIEKSKVIIDIVSHGVSKGNGIKQYADLKGIKKNEIMAIGNDFNDISMLECAGFSVAMGNAEEIVKSKADYITKDNNNHGVAHAIREQLREGGVYGQGY
ncbi:Cof-type HAD-IIB family hydrolase [Clostridium sediminicola]|uniref:Cof-type HAD-IIB family hydrolase n=1 Tax=Clostridium sediminicola TaxID=3114879 RepID=UPI0031F1F3A8